MKNIIITLVLCFFSLVCSAQSETLHLGYCNGEATTSSNAQYDGRGWVEGAIHIPASALSAYEGGSIDSVRLYLVRKINIDTLQVWVRSKLTGANITEGTLTLKSQPSFKKGWNVVALETPLQLTNLSGDYYIGYSFHQRSTVEAGCFVGEAIGGTSYLKMGDNDWQDMARLGNLCVEAVVRSNRIPTHNLGLLSAMLSPYPTMGPNTYQVSVALHNYGSSNETGVSITATNTKSGDITTHLTENVAPNYTKLLRFYINPNVSIADGTHWDISITGLDENEDEIAADNSITPTFSYLRNVLLEEFTTEQCSNCPWMADTLKQIMASNPNYNDRVTIITHHSGYYTDSFTKDCDNDYLSFYAHGSYAPAVMIDRDVDVYEEATPVFFTQQGQLIKYIIDDQMLHPANVYLSISCQLNKEKTQANVHVKAHRNAYYSTLHPRLNVFMLEDRVSALSQAGTADPNYKHNNINRGYNSTWGEPVVWDENNDFNYDCSFPIDPSWKTRDMKLAAFIYNYNANDAKDRRVDNSAHISLSEAVANSIETATANQRQEIGRYNIQGLKTGLSAKGLVIIRYSDGSAEKALIR